MLAKPLNFRVKAYSTLLSYYQDMYYLGAGNPPGFVLLLFKMLFKQVQLNPDPGPQMNACGDALWPIWQKLQGSNLPTTGS